MPLIQIDLDAELYERAGDQLSDAVHAAQLAALDIPGDDLFQVFTPRPKGELRFDRTFGGVDRQQLVLVRVTMVHMYPVATKRRFLRPWPSASPRPASGVRTS
ncbi:hypothetical protein [Microlunatus flavus]|uniref:Tautomerase enzyme n=1 Tax=Microlunatus flavus TaxID=1036181 RepID=A0A1H8Z0Y9_9ACTN|nr:hypothetical protein [Microlunatus flavus]SEP58023.1 hypothetical protein SAMN05421756_10144 [Microlunatus flavus]